MAHSKNIITAGQSLTSKSKVLVMLHGRGGSAEDILSLSSHLDIDGFSLLAPQATNHSWYPYSFLAPVEQNEPWLTSAINLLKELVDDVKAKGIPFHHIYFTGFSQGACLLLEFAARHATRYGGIAAFTGGLIGQKINTENYKGDFAGTPVFIGTANPDMHVPVARVYATANILKDMKANVTEKIYEGMGHTINQDEIEQANKLIFHVYADKNSQ